MRTNPMKILAFLPRLGAACAAILAVGAPVAFGQITLTATGADNRNGYIQDGGTQEDADGIGDWSTPLEGGGTINVFRLQALDFRYARGAFASFDLPAAPAGHVFSSAKLTLIENPGGNPNNYDIGIYHSSTTVFPDYDNPPDPVNPINTVLVAEAYNLPAITAGTSPFSRAGTLYSTNNGVDDGTGFFDGRFYTDNDISAAIASEYAAFDGEANLLFAYEVPAEAGSPEVPGALITASDIATIGNRSVFFNGGAPTIDVTFDPIVIGPGDFDSDGDVDGGDFLLWQRDPTAFDLSEWQDNYDGSGLSASVATVPEPGTWVLLLAGLPAMIRRRRCR